MRFVKPVMDSGETRIPDVMLFVVRRRDEGLEYSFRKGTLDGLLESVHDQKGRVVDFDVIYPDDFARLRESPTLGITLLEVPVAFLFCQGKSEEASALPVLSANETGRVFDYVIVRSQYRYRPIDAPHRGVVTVFELLRNATRTQAKSVADAGGRVKEEMNYFSDDFDFAGTTVYEGVCSMVGFDALDLDGISVLDSSFVDEQVLLVMSQKELESALAIVRQVDERRRSLDESSRQCNNAEKKEDSV